MINRLKEIMDEMNDTMMEYKKDRREGRNRTDLQAKYFNLRDEQEMLISKRDEVKELIQRGFGGVRITEMINVSLEDVNILETRYGIY